MSKTSNSIALNCVPDVGTFRPYLLCNKGELWQNYTGDPATTTSVTPDYSVASNQPVISVYLSSSRVGGEELAASVTFYIGAAEIGTVEPGAGGSYTKTLKPAFTGCFSLLSPTENGGQYGLKITKNLVNITNGSSGSISAKLTVADGTSYSELRCSIPFLVSEVTSNSREVHIIDGNGTDFHLSAKDDSIVLKAEAYDGLSKLSAGLSYEWYRQEAGANAGDPDLENWKLIPSATTDSLTIRPDDVDTSRLYMVVVRLNGSYIGQDTQMVYDKSDVYDLVIDCNPATGQVKSAGDTVTLTSAVYGLKTSGTWEALTLKNPVWAYAGTTPSGTPIVLDNKSTSNTIVLTYNDINTKAGGSLIVTVSVEFDI